MGLGVVFKIKIKKGVLLQTFLKTGSTFNLSLKKYPRPGPGRSGPGPGTQAPMGYFFKLSLKMDPVFKIVWKRTPFFKLFWKWALDRFSKLSWMHFFKVSPFDKGCKSLLMHDQLRKGPLGASSLHLRGLEKVPPTKRKRSWARFLNPYPTHHNPPHKGGDDGVE